MTLSEALSILPAAPLCKFFFQRYCFLGVFYFSLLLHLKLHDLSTRLALVHRSAMEQGEAMPLTARGKVSGPHGESEQEPNLRQRNMT